MNRAVRVQADKNSDSVRVFEGVGPYDPLELFQPTYVCTRIWMGVVPPEEELPGYAAVVGELNDFDPRQRERTCILLDEGVALDPADFSEVERDRFNIPPDNVRRPTKRRLAQAVVALKDLWAPSAVLLPPGGRPDDRGDRVANPWTDFMRNTEGLQVYDSAFGPEYYREWFPFYHSTKRTANVREVEVEDRQYNVALMEALFDADSLKIAENCKIFLEQRLACCERAIGLVLSEMERLDTTKFIRFSRFGDDYGDLHRDVMTEERLQEALAATEDKLMWLERGARR